MSRAGVGGVGWGGWDWDRCQCGHGPWAGQSGRCGASDEDAARALKVKVALESHAPQLQKWQMEGGALQAGACRARAPLQATHLRV